MSDLSRRTFLSLAGAAGLVQVAQPAAARTTAGPPQTIPALQAWTPATGTFTLRPGARIVVPPGDHRLRETADVLAEDLYVVTGLRVPRVEQHLARAGDLHLRRGEAGHGEAYRLRVGDRVEVTGPAAGVFWGTRTLVQWFRQTLTVPRGEAEDRPRYPERGLLVCNTPKRFSLPWWRAQIRELSYLKLNLLWIYVGYDTTPAAETAEIARFASRYNVTVVPQLNMPGHMEKLLFEHPEMALPGRIESLDLSNPAAYRFAEGLAEPLLDTFDTPFWHTGADEYMLGSDYDRFPQLAAYAKQTYGPAAVPEDLQNGFLNGLNRITRSHGKTLRVWNDGLLTNQTVALDNDVIVEHWFQRPGAKSAQQLIDEGFRLNNSNQDFLYYDPGRRRPDPKAIYERFHAGLFSENTTVPDDSPALLGAKLSLWPLPDVETAEQESDGLAPGLRSLAQILWGSPNPAPAYEGFEPLATRLGRAPGFPVMRIEPSPLDGAGSVPPDRSVSAHLYDEPRPGSVRISLRHEHGRPVAGTASYDPATRTATFTPAAALSHATTYVATVTAEPAIRSRTPNPPLCWSFRTARAAGGVPLSLWADTEAPALASANDSHAVELGVRFTADVAGTVDGVRFYKGPSNIGRHFGKLWSADGRLLAQALFTGETTTGWQQVRFGEPVPIDAGTVYVASYYAQVGGYAATGSGLAAGHDNGVLHAPAGSNGVYLYGGGGFPTESFNDTNYWVDVLFTPGGGS